MMKADQFVSVLGDFNPRLVLGFALCLAGVFLAMFGLAAAPPDRSAKAAALAAEGNWSLVASPNTNGSQENDLYSVTCPSPSNCWAVGAAYNGSAYETLIQRWDGTLWSIVPSPNPGSADNVLFSVTCSSASECWAVGYYQGTQTNNLSRTLIERWDGTSWSVVTSPNAVSPVPNNYLTGITCTSATNCWAVGYYFINVIYVAPGTLGTSLFQTLIEHWDGTSWTIVPSANTVTTQTNILTSVTCASAADCWAAGYYYSASNGGIPGLTQTLIEHWNGTSWSIVASPNILAAEDHILTGVTCTATADCWAVGYHYLSTYATSPIYQTLIEHWDGTSWTIATSPNTSAAQQNVLFGATCNSASDCWAVGFYVTGDAGVVNAFFQTLIEHWDGTSWSIFASPNTTTAQSNLLYGIGCSSTYDCWAVGKYISGVPQTLTEHYVAPRPLSLVGAASRKTHGSAGAFDVDLSLDGSGIECRSGGANGDHTIVFNFTNSLTSVDAASTNCGSISGRMIDSSDAHQYVVDVTGCTANAQSITVGLTGVHDNQGNVLGVPTPVSASMNLLLGDTTADRSVNSADIAQTKSQSGTAVTSSNFREDVNTDGSLNSGDIALVKSKSGTALP
jgi:hypothetical protein